MSKRSDQAMNDAFPMYRPLRLREQTDLISTEEKVRLFGTKCPPEEDRARQEFKAEADTATLLTRFGAGAAFGMPPGGSVDYTLTLQQAIHATREADAAYERLPAELRAEFRSWADLARSVGDGTFASWEARVKATKEELETREKAYQAYRARDGSSSGAGEASPSDSAAEGPPKGGKKGDKPS